MLNFLRLQNNTVRPLETEDRKTAVGAAVLELQKSLVNELKKTLHKAEQKGKNLHLPLAVDLDLTSRAMRKVLIRPGHTKGVDIDDEMAGEVASKAIGGLETALKTLGFSSLGTDPDIGRSNPRMRRVGMILKWPLKSDANALLENFDSPKARQPTSKTGWQ